MSTKTVEHPALRKLQEEHEGAKALLERVFKNCEPTKKSLKEIRRAFSKDLKENETSRRIIEERA